MPRAERGQVVKVKTRPLVIADLGSGREKEPVKKALERSAWVREEQARGSPTPGVSRPRGLPG